MFTYRDAILCRCGQRTQTAEAPTTSTQAWGATCSLCCMATLVLTWTMTTWAWTPSCPPPWQPWQWGDWTTGAAHWTWPSMPPTWTSHWPSWARHSLWSWWWRRRRFPSIWAPWSLLCGSLPCFCRRLLEWMGATACVSWGPPPPPPLLAQAPVQALDWPKHAS